MYSEKYELLIMFYLYVFHKLFKITWIFVFRWFFLLWNTGVSFAQLLKFVLLRNLTFSLKVANIYIASFVVVVLIIMAGCVFTLLSALFISRISRTPSFFSNFN